MTKARIVPPPAMRRTKGWLLGALLAAAGTAQASGLGDIAVRSHLGERLRVEILLVGDSSGKGPECFHLSDALAGSDLPHVRNAGIAVLQNPPRIVVTSRDTVYEPAIQLALFYGCGVYLSRTYTVLLSPRSEREQEIVPPTAPAARDERKPADVKPRETQAVSRVRVLLPGESPAEMARRLYPRSPSYQKRFVRELIALNPDRVAADTVEQPLVDGAALKIPPRFVAARPAQPGSRAGAPASDTAPAVPAAPARAAGLPPAPAAKTAPPAAADRLVLSAPDDATGTPPPELLQVEMEQRLRDIIGQTRSLNVELASLQAQFPNPPAEIQTRLLEMETRLARMELAAVRIKLSMAQTTVPTAPAGDAAPPVVPAPPAAASPTATAETAPAVQPAEPAKPAAEPVRRAPAAPVQPATSEDSGNSLWGIGLLAGFAAALAAYLVRNSRRRSRRETEDMPEPTARTIAASGEEASARPATPAPATAPATPAAGTATAPTDFAVDLDFDTGKPEVPPEFERPMPGDVEIVEVAHVLAIFGRTQSAIDVLSEFIGQHPDKALNPGLYLLKIYKQTNRPDDFAALAARLHAEFNVRKVGWDEPIEDMAPVDPAVQDYRTIAHELEKIPHIYSRISDQWGSRECLDYLQQLLHENREGHRGGFSLLETSEILALIALLQKELAAAPARDRS